LIEDGKISDETQQKLMNISAKDQEFHKKANDAIKDNVENHTYVTDNDAARQLDAVERAKNDNRTSSVTKILDTLLEGKEISREVREHLETLEDKTQECKKDNKVLAEFQSDFDLERRSVRGIQNYIYSLEEAESKQKDDPNFDYSSAIREAKIRLDVETSEEKSSDVNKPSEENKSSEEKSSDVKRSSLLDDYADVNSEMPSYMDPED
jgi:hypothetical protein